MEVKEMEAVYAALLLNAVEKQVDARSIQRILNSVNIEIEPHVLEVIVESLSEVDLATFLDAVELPCNQNLADSPVEKFNPSTPTTEPEPEPENALAKLFDSR
jgi:ribosomal protein L12E/L44/L45/RPP1/RPP2